MTSRHKRWPIALCLTALALTTTRAQDDAGDLAALVKALDIHAGSVVADIGAGPEALLTLPIAHLVGPSGHVYATELGAAVQGLRTTLDKAGVTNVEVIAGDPARTNLPSNCCDGIVIRFVYHHFADPPAMNASLRQALKAGGRVAVLDFAPPGPEASAPAERAGGTTHGVTATTVERELAAAGFDLIGREPRAERAFLVVARKPSSP